MEWEAECIMSQLYAFARGCQGMILQTPFVTRAQFPEAGNRREEPKGKAAGSEIPESVPRRYADGFEGPATQPLGFATGRGKKGFSDRA